MLRKFLFFLVLLLLLSSANSYSQNYQWAAAIGGNVDDAGNMIFTDNKGFVYVVGYFSGNNVDFDPSPSATAYLSSMGNNRDGFVAKYTETGKYVWAFRFGGTGLDIAGGVSVDNQGNVYVTGYFRGQGVDFDPSPTGTALLNSNGDQGGDPGYGGDIFIAKYNSNGQYVWAFNIGGTGLGDNGTVIVTDDAGNVYTGGYFNSSADFDPSSGTKTLDASNGVVYLAKYNTDGKYQWAFNVGQPNGNSHPFGLKIDASSNIYVAGYIIGTGLDFDPSPTSTAILNSNGVHDIFLAKYNTDGQYQWAESIGGGGSDVARELDLDNTGNIYLAGDFQNTVDFDPSSSTANLSSKGGSDIFIAKYANNGKYIWAKRFGGTSSDIAWGVAYTSNNVYLTGSYQGTVDFDPGTTPDNLTSNGGSDIYVTKFDVNGNYVCAFGIGGANTDEASRIEADNSGNLYLTGMLSSNNTDFDPGTGTKNLISNGSSDIFVAKYNWPDNPKPTGTFSGSTVCSGQQAKLTFTATSGTGPFTIEYSNNSTIYTQTNVQSGVPFNVSPSPLATTVYKLVSIKDATKCAATNNVSGITATVTVSSGVSTDFTFAQSPCSPKSVQFVASSQSASNYSWDFGNGTTVTGISNPSVTYSNYGVYTVKLTSSGSGCSENSEKIVPVSITYANVILTSDTTICSGTSLRLATDSGINFCWKPDPSIRNPNIANATVTPTRNTTYYFTTQVETANLVVNGDFSQGNTGFTSDYNSASRNTKEAEYYVANDSYAWNANFNSCVEHTTGAGKMMMVNGSSAGGSKVWGQSITVSPNTNYSFSLWIESLAALNPANLRFSINGIVLGDNINAGNVACEWKKVFTTWNSGNTTTATITVVNNNTIADGNDFAIDDISFSKVFLSQDSIKVNVTPPPNIRTRPDTAICEGTSIQLNATGGTVYSWSPAAGLSDPNTQNTVAKPGVTTKYIVSAYNEPGCVGTDTVTIDVLKSPDISLSNDTTICFGTKTQLIASGGTKYQWTPTAGLSADNISNPVAAPADITNYFVTVTNATGCSRKDSVVIAVAQNPTVSTISNTSACEGTPVRLQTSSSAGVSYSWYPGTGLSDSSIASPLANPSGTTDYIVTAKTPEKCEASDTVRLTVLNSPTVKVSNDTTVCNGGTAPLHAAGGVNYKWTPATGLSDANVNNPVASIDRTTTYTVLVTSDNGCSKSDSVKLLVRPSPVFKIQPATKSVCEKDTLALTASGGDLYNWLNTGSVTPANRPVIIVKPEINTIYKVRIYDSVCKQDDTLDASIIVTPLPVVSIRKSNDIDCSFTTSILTASGGEKYSWTPSGQMNNTNIPNPVVSPVTTTYYKVKVTNAEGCSNFDSIKVVVSFNSLASRLELPTAFTPNNDGKNDCFGIKSWGPVTQLDFSIFNRWGERVFYTKNPSDCWDGTYKNLQQNTGGFVYYIKAKSFCGGEFDKKGTIALIR